MVVLAFAEGGSIQLVPDGTILIHIALILLMIYILNRTFFRPINRILETRERKGGAGGDAQSILEQVNQKTSEYNAAMREARVEGYNLIESERSKAVADRESKIESVKAEVSEKLAAENESLQKQTVEARTALQTEAQSIADKISSSILKA
jgi:F0F1-type ATP synthase membrane subunit b/b'